MLDADRSIRNNERKYLFLTLFLLLAAGMGVGLYFGNQREYRIQSESVMRIKLECYENAQRAGLSSSHCAQLGK